MRSIVVQITLAFLIAIALQNMTYAAPPPTFAVDQTVEVREGDAWSVVTVVKKEGRKYQIRYDDGTEEWVTPDRLRAVASFKNAEGEGATTLPSDGTGKKSDDPKPDSKKKDQPTAQFSVGQKVEVKWGMTWFPSKIKQKSANGWTLIVYDDWDTLEWVEPWRIRKLGSKEDTVGNAQPRTTLRKAEPPPKEAPGEAPPPFGMHLPAGGGGGEAGGSKRLDPFAPKPYDKPITDIVTNKVDELIFAGGPKKLSTFDPFPAAPTLSDRAYVLQGKSEWPTDGPSNVVLGGNKAVVIYEAGHGPDQRTKQIECLDLITGKSSGAIDFDPLSKPIAISPTGKRLAGRAQGFHSGTMNRLDLFDMSGAEPKHLISFVPYPDDQMYADVKWAAFADDDHVMTCNGSGSLILWDAPKATAVWRASIYSGTFPAASPGGKQLAMRTNDGLVVADIRSGKVLCAIDGPALNGISFTPDGKEIIGSDGTVVSVCDLAKGEVQPGIGMPVNSFPGKVIPAGNGHVLLGGMDLLDLDHKVVVWRYNGAGTNGAFAYGDRCWAFVKDGDRQVLTNAVLPHPGAIKAGEGAAQHALLVKPGDTVSLEIAIDATEEQRQKILNAITAELRRNEISVGADRPVKLVARTELGKVEDRDYEERRFGFGPPSSRTEKVSVSDKITRISFESNGKVVWESRHVSGAPWTVNPKEGQSITQAVQEASKFNLAFLENVCIPACVTQPTEKADFGQSHWSAGGIKDDR